MGNIDGLLLHYDIFLQSGRRGRRAFLQICVERYWCYHKIYYVSGISMINVAPLIAIVILYSRTIQALRKKFNAGPLSGNTNSEGKRCKQLQHIMKIFKSIVIAYSACFFIFCVYLILKMTFHDIFIKDKCKWILGFSYFVLPLLSTAMNPVILFCFSSNFRHALQTFWSFRRTNFCCSCFKGRKAEVPIRQNERETTAL